MKQSLLEIARTNKFEDLETEWLELMISHLTDTETFLQVSEILRARSQGAKAASFLNQLIDEMLDKKVWDALEEVLYYCSENYSKMRNLRERALTCIKEINSSNPLLDNYLEKSGLNSEKDLFTCWKEFKTYSYLVPGAFVLHITQFGAGVITAASTETDKITIDFIKKKNHSMGLVFAAKVLTELPADHFYSQIVKDQEAVEEMKEKEPAEFVKVVAKSFGPEILVSKLKDELTLTRNVPLLINLKENPRGWTSWWAKAKKAVGKDKYLTLTAGAKGTITVREHELSYSDEAFENLTKPITFAEKVNIVKNFLKDNGPDEAGQLLESLESSLIEAKEKFNIIEALTVLIEGKYKVDEIKPQLDALLESLGDPCEKGTEIVKVVDSLYLKTLGQLKINDCKKSMLNHIQISWPENWPRIYQAILHLDDLFLWGNVSGILSKEYPDLLAKALQSVFSSPDKYPGAFQRLMKDIINEKLEGEGFPSRIETLRKAIFILEIESVNDDTRALQAVIPKFFLEKKCSALYIDHLQACNKEEIEPIFRSLTSREEKGESKMRASILRAVSKRFPAFIKKAQAPYWENADREFMLTSSQERMKTEVDEIVNIKLPENSKAIGAAQELGDLSENAEFDAAKEERENLNRRAQLLKGMLERASLIDALQRKGDIVELGVKVSIKNLDDDSSDSFTILSANEANVEEKVLNFKAPFAWAMLGKKEGDNFIVTREAGTSTEYEVEKIELVNF